MKNPAQIKNEFYIKVNKKKPLKDEKINENESIFDTTFKDKTLNLENYIYYTEKKNYKSKIKNLFNPINKEINLWKINKIKEKSVKENNTPTTSKKYKKKIIHIENANKDKIQKCQTKFPLNNNNFSTKIEKKPKVIRNYFSPQNNINLTTSKKPNLKGRTDLRTYKAHIINYEQMSGNKSSRGKLKNIKLFFDNKQINKNKNDLINSPKYSKTIINDNSQSYKNKKYVKKINYKIKGEENNNNDKKMIYIYKTKLITIFVKLMNDFYKKQIKRIFSIFIYKLKDETYFFNIKKTLNKNNKIFNNISKNRIYDYNTKNNNQDSNANYFEKYLFFNKDFQSMTMYHMKFNKKEEDNTKKIYIPIHNRHEDNKKIKEKYYNKDNLSNPKYKIFDNMKIDKNQKKIEEQNEIYKNQNINTQINNYYNTKNTNFYFNKINSFNSLVIEKQRPRYYYPKEIIKPTSMDKINNLSANMKKNKNINTPKTNMKNILTSIENRSKNLIYKKILSKEKKKKINDDNIESLVNRTEQIFNKKNSLKKYNNILTQDKNYLINYYTTIAHIKDSNNSEDLSNDFHNYCLEDIDKPMNMIYSKNQFEDDENIEKDTIKNIKQIKTSDRLLYMNFNYIKYKRKNKQKDFAYTNNNELRQNKLLISKVNSIFILNRNESELEKIEIKNNFILKLNIFINNIILKYKSYFFDRIKGIKFKSVIDEISKRQKIDNPKKFFDIQKANKKIKDIIKNPESTNNYYNKSNEKTKENLDKNDNYDEKFESFRIKLLKYIFCRKSM